MMGLPVVSTHMLEGSYGWACIIIYFIALALYHFLLVLEIVKKILSIFLLMALRIDQLHRLIGQIIVLANTCLDVRCEFTSLLHELVKGAKSIFHTDTSKMAVLQCSRMQQQRSVSKSVIQQKLYIIALSLLSTCIPSL